MINLDIKTTAMLLLICLLVHYMPFVSVLKPSPHLDRKVTGQLIVRLNEALEMNTVEMKC